MTPNDAAKLLELPDHATPDQVEARFHELRARLEDKIAKAPTPGLKAKYRESLDEITQAFEVLTIAADSSALPILKKEAGGGRPEAGGQVTEDRRRKAEDGGQGTDTSGLRSQVSGLPAARRKSGGKEFLIVAVIAVVVLGAGGWWVLKTKAENEEKARIAAEAKAEAERKAAADKAEAERQALLAKEQAEREKLAKEAADKAEKERLERMFTQVRSRMAELNVSYDAAMRSEQAAERELSELKSQERDLAREQKGSPNPELRRLSAQTRAQERLVTWMRSALPVHPARVAKAKADELLSARVADEAAAAVDAFSAALTQLKADIARERSDLAVTGTLKLSSNLEETTWQLTDAFGIERSGQAPATLDDVAFGKGTLVFRRSGWADIRLTVDYRKGTDGVVAADFPIGSVTVDSTPAGAQVRRGEQVLGVTPLRIAPLPPGDFEVRVTQKGFKGQKLTGRVERDRTLALGATLVAGRALDTEMIYERALEDLPLIRSPKLRANTAAGFVASARLLSGVPKETVIRYIDLHRESARQITDPEGRMTTMLYQLENIAGLDLERGRSLAREVVASLPLVTDKSQRQTVLHGLNYLAIYPEEFAAACTAAERWFVDKEDWIYIATVAQLQKRAGLDAAAQRTAARAMDPGPYGEFQNKTVQEYVTKGAVARQTLPLQLALIRQDLPAAQQALARISGNLEYSDLFTLATAFIRLGDFDSPRRLARMAEAEYISAAQTIYAIAMLAFSNGHIAVGEQWAAGIADTVENPQRSQLYRFFADQYLRLGKRMEAAAALAKVTTFSNSEWATDRLETATVCALLGQTDRARQLIAAQPVAFTKEGVNRLRSAAPAYAALGDTAAVERAMQVIQANATTSSDYIYQSIASTYVTAGKFPEAERYFAQIRDKETFDHFHSTLLTAQLRGQPDGVLEEKIDESAPGANRLALFSVALGREIERANTARNQAKP